MSALRDEIKQTRPFGSLEEEVYLSLRLTAQLMNEPWARYLRKTEGISPSQYNILRILRGAGVDGRTMGEIAERMINRDPDVTRLADRTVKLGLARRDRDETDRRVVKLFITQRGLDMLERLDRPVVDFMKQALGGLGPKRLKELRDLLSAARASLRPFPAANS
jgi:DNA-binding MarR family transcriptional regulator